MAIRTDAWISLVHVLAPAQHVAVSGRACAQAESTARQHRVRDSARDSVRGSARDRARESLAESSAGQHRVRGSARGSVRDRARQSLARLLAAHASGATHIGQRREQPYTCLLYTSPSPRDATLSRMPSSA